MNRRRFIELLASATVTAGVAYSFPSVIVPRVAALEFEFVPLLNSTPVWISCPSMPEAWAEYCQRFLGLASTTGEFSNEQP